MIAREQIEGKSNLRFIHVNLRNKDNSPLRARQSGVIKFWKTRPDDFRIPVKYGLRTCFYIDNDNASEWIIE